MGHSHSSNPILYSSYSLSHNNPYTLRDIDGWNSSGIREVDINYYGTSIYNNPITQRNVCQIRCKHCKGTGRVLHHTFSCGNCAGKGYT